MVVDHAMTNGVFLEFASVVTPAAPPSLEPALPDAPPDG
jgi:hypothetical protein